jgi:hypothetical protein
VAHVWVAGSELLLVLAVVGAILLLLPLLGLTKPAAAEVEWEALSGSGDGNIDGGFFLISSIEDCNGNEGAEPT